MEVKSSNVFDHFKQFFLVFGSKKVLLIVVLERNAIGHFEDSLGDFLEELSLEEVKLECLFD